MKKYTFVLVVFLLLALPKLSWAQCQPGWTGPFTYGLIMIPNPANPSQQCTYLVHYCYYVWPSPGVTKYSYDFWIETWDCPLSIFNDAQRATIYSQISEQLVLDNPAEFPTNPCGAEDANIIVDVTHANCVYEEIIHHATLQDPNAPDSYIYRQCSGSGQCFERYWVCDSCLYGYIGYPVYNCVPAPPGQADRKKVAHKTASWTTGSETCGTVNMPWGEVPCMTVCNADGPGPSLGLSGPHESPTFVQSVPAVPQHAANEHRHEVQH